VRFVGREEQCLAHAPFGEQRIPDHHPKDQPAVRAPSSIARPPPRRQLERNIRLAGPNAFGARFIGELLHLDPPVGAAFATLILPVGVARGVYPAWRPRLERIRPVPCTLRP
jgi:hypothetical protein